MKITYRTPAKVILSGEHAVVYGKPALICGLGIYATVTVADAERKQFPHPACEYIENAVLAYLKKHKISYTDRPYQVTADVQIPISRGLGSSAALSVCMSAALLEFLTGTEFEKEQINAVAYAAEKQFHGNPSGADNSTCCYGGLVFYRKEFEFLKTLSVLHGKLPEPIERRLYLIDSGAPRESTKDMVRLVGKRYNADPSETDAILARIEKATKRMVVSIIKEDIELFRSCIEDNHYALESLGVVSSSCKKLLNSLSDYGVGKITGAGGNTKGSGFILFYCDDPNELEKKLTSLSVPWFNIQQDYQGVTRI
ncbi:MAG: mevalonate kinase [Patescibacteria group bacterium]